MQKVVPLKWGQDVAPPVTVSANAVALGNKAEAWDIALALGHNAKAQATGSAAIGLGATTRGAFSFSVGFNVKASSAASIAIGSQLSETVDGSNVTRTCKTEGTGSITIGAGANTLNTTAADGTVTESSNAVTIGCKASNSGADSVVIGAQASSTRGSSVVIGASAKGADGVTNSFVSIGRDATAHNYATAVGGSARGGVQAAALGSGATAENFAVSIGTNAYAGVRSISIGNGSRVSSTGSVALSGSCTKGYCVAIGKGASAADYGVVVHRSTAGDGTVTQLYFSGANTPLATTYEGGAPMLGYTVTDSAGNVTAAGTRSLLDLLTNNSTFAPATTDENGELVQPKVFHPSDLDLPQEEPTEPETEEEYTPLPVYPIVEPEIEE